MMLAKLQSEKQQEWTEEKNGEISFYRWRNLKTVSSFVKLSEWIVESNDFGMQRWM